MHPIERLRMVARAGREDSTVLAREAASALASLGGQPAALVTACRRLGDRQPPCAPVWAVAGVGRVLPDQLWQALAGALADRTPAWAQDEEIVPLAWVDAVVGPAGVVPVEDALAWPTCPPAPELSHRG